MRIQIHMCMMLCMMDVICVTYHYMGMCVCAYCVYTYMCIIIYVYIYIYIWREREREMDTHDMCHMCRWGDEYTRDVRKLISCACVCVCVCIRLAACPDPLRSRTGALSTPDLLAVCPRIASRCARDVAQRLSPRGRFYSWKHDCLMGPQMLGHR